MHQKDKRDDKTYRCWRVRGWANLRRFDKDLRGLYLALHEAIRRTKSKRSLELMPPTENLCSSIISFSFKYEMNLV